MWICIPTKTNEGYGARVVSYLAHAQYLMLYNTDLHYLRMIKNKTRHHTYGKKKPREIIRDCHVQAVISSGLGKKELNTLEHMGIKFYQTNDKNVEEVLEHLDKSLLQETM